MCTLPSRSSLLSMTLALAFVLLMAGNARGETVLSVNTVTGASFGETSTVDLWLTGIDGEVVGWLVDLEYDPTQLEILDVATDGTISVSCAAFWNAEFSEGVLRIATACTFPIEDGGLLVRLAVTPAGVFPDGTAIPLVVRRAILNEIQSVDVTVDGTVIIGGITSVDGPHQNFVSVDVFPNPARSGSVVTFSLGARAGARDARVEIYDLRGRRVTEALATQPDGSGWTAFWVADTPRGSLAGGVYLYRITTRDTVRRGRITIVP